VRQELQMSQPQAARQQAGFRESARVAGMARPWGEVPAKAQEVCSAWLPKAQVTAQRDESA
jgi:hypothetical protein